MILSLNFTECNKTFQLNVFDTLKKLVTLPDQYTRLPDCIAKDVL